MRAGLGPADGSEIRLGRTGNSRHSALCKTLFILLLLSLLIHPLSSSPVLSGTLLRGPSGGGTGNNLSLIAFLSRFTRCPDLFCRHNINIVTRPSVDNVEKATCGPGARPATGFRTR